MSPVRKPAPVTVDIARRETDDPTKRRGICSVCDVLKRLNDRGLIKLHWRHGAVCDGSARQPRAPMQHVRNDDPLSRGPSTYLRRDVLERDCYRCRKCHIHRPDGRGLEAHHVIAYSSGGKTTLDNLDTLCSMCHVELSWLWVNEPPFGYERWLAMTPAVLLVQTLLLGLDGVDIDIPREMIERLLLVRQE